MMRGMISSLTKGKRWLSKTYGPHESVINQESEVLKLLSSVVEPLTKRSLSAVGMIHSVKVKPLSPLAASSAAAIVTKTTTSSVASRSVGVVVDLDVLIPGYTKTGQLLKSCFDVLEGIPWVNVQDSEVGVMQRCIFIILMSK